MKIHLLMCVNVCVSLFSGMFIRLCVCFAGSFKNDSDPDVNQAAGKLISYHLRCLPHKSWLDETCIWINFLSVLGNTTGWKSMVSVILDS